MMLQIYLTLLHKGNQWSRAGHMPALTLAACCLPGKKDVYAHSDAFMVAFIYLYDRL